MIIRFLLLIAFIPFSLHAAEFWAYSYGDVTTAKDVATLLASFRDDLNYQELIFLSMLTGATLTATVKRFMSLASFGTYFLGSTGLLLLIFGSTTSLNLVNVRFYESTTPPPGLHYQRVDNVPYIFSFVASSFSTMGYYFTKKIDDNFVAIGGDFADERKTNSFLKSGLNGSFKLFSKLNATDLQSISEKGIEFTKDFKEYSDLCIFGTLHAYDPISTTVMLKHSQNMIADIDPTSTAMSTIASIGNFVVQTSEGSKTCQEIYNGLKSTVDEFKASNDIPNFFNTLLKASVANPTDMLGGIAGMFSGATGGTNTIKLKNYVLNTAMMKQLSYNYDSYIDEVKGGASVSGSVGTFGTALSKGTFVTTSLTQGKFASETLPTLQEIIRAYMWVAFPIIFIVQLIGGGIKILTSYVLALLWVELWPPSYSILNYFVQKDAAVGATDTLIATANSGAGLPTLLNIANTDMVLDSISVSSAIASSTFWLIPVLTGFLLYGGHHSLMGLTNGLIQGGMTGAGLDTQAQKQQLQDSFNTVKESGLTSHINAESYAYENKLAKDTESGSVTQSQIAAFGGLSGLSSISGKNASLDASSMQGKTNTMTEKGALNSGIEQGLNANSLDAKYNAILDEGLTLQEAADGKAKTTGLSQVADTETLNIHGNDTYKDSLLLKNEKGIASYKSEKIIADSNDTTIVDSLTNQNLTNKSMVKNGSIVKESYDASGNKINTEVSQHTNEGVLTISTDNDGNIVRSKLDGTTVKDTSVITKDDTINTQTNLTDTSVITKDDTINTQTNLTDTSVITKDDTINTQTNLTDTSVITKDDTINTQTKLTDTSVITKDDTINTQTKLTDTSVTTKDDNIFSQSTHIDKSYLYNESFKHESTVNADLSGNRKKIYSSDGQVDVMATMANASAADTAKGATGMLGNFATPFLDLYTSAKANVIENTTNNDGSKTVNFTEDKTKLENPTALDIAAKKGYNK